MQKKSIAICNPQHNESDPLCQLAPAFQKLWIKVQKQAPQLVSSFVTHSACAKFTNLHRLPAFLRTLLGRLKICEGKRAKPQFTHFVDLLLQLFLCDVKFTHILPLASLSVRLDLDCQHQGHMIKFTYTSKRKTWSTTPALDTTNYCQRSCHG